MPRLSVVIASNTAWPAATVALDSLYAQVHALGAELLFLSSKDATKPAELGDRFPDATWLYMPGMSVHEMRIQGILRATGEIIAWTEDHVRVAPDWCEGLLRAHAEHPEAMAIGGAVENGHPESLRDCAHHYLIFGPAVAPLSPGRPPESGAANFSIKRALSPMLPKADLAEMFLIRELARARVTMASDERITVDHCQSFPLHHLCRYHFHNGRTIAGFRRGSLTPLMRVFRSGASAILPVYLVGLRVGQMWRKRRHRARLLASLPWMLCLVCAQAAGEAIGHLAGPGGSPQILR